MRTRVVCGIIRLIVRIEFSGMIVTRRVRLVEIGLRWGALFGGLRSTLGLIYLCVFRSCVRTHHMLAIKPRTVSDSELAIAATPPEQSRPSESSELPVLR